MFPVCWNCCCISRKSGFRAVKAYKKQICHVSWNGAIPARIWNKTDLFWFYSSISCMKEANALWKIGMEGFGLFFFQRRFKLIQQFSSVTGIVTRSFVMEVRCVGIINAPSLISTKNMAVSIFGTSCLMLYVEFAFLNIWRWKSLVIGLSLWLKAINGILKTMQWTFLN